MYHLFVPAVIITWIAAKCTVPQNIPRARQDITSSPLSAHGEPPRRAPLIDPLRTEGPLSVKPLRTVTEIRPLMMLTEMTPLLPLTKTRTASFFFKNIGFCSILYLTFSRGRDIVIMDTIILD